MSASTGGFAEACTSWLSSLSHCCAPLASCFAKRYPRRYDEKMHFPVVSEPPAFQPHLGTELETVSQRGGACKRRSKATKKSKAFGWMDLSVRGRFGSDASRRPLISAPSDFRHIHSSSFCFPTAQQPDDARLPRLRGSSSSLFQPLELSIHHSRSHMSPILPHFEFPRSIATPPPAYLPDGPDVENELMRQRSYESSSSFNVPRKQLPDSSLSTSSGDSPPRIPPRAPGRARAHTSPEMDRIKERVASAMLEMESLQRQIDDVIERQSIYVGSRPSTAHSMALAMPDLEPMPSIPALPPAAPSFAERLNLDMERPQTAPINRHRQRQSEDSVPQVSPQLAPSSPPLPPPLPLVLRPPLRKKKSFSRVSTWLFRNSEQDSDANFDSITTIPRPIRGHEGFYQCVDSQPRRLSYDSLTTVSTWHTDDDDLVSPPTACSPESTPVIKHEEPFLERTATFGKSSGRSSRPGVGVAF